MPLLSRCSKMPVKIEPDLQTTKEMASPRRNTGRNRCKLKWKMANSKDVTTIAKAGLERANIPEKTTPRKVASSHTAGRTAIIRNTEAKDWSFDAVIIFSIKSLNCCGMGKNWFCTYWMVPMEN